MLKISYVRDNIFNAMEYGILDIQKNDFLKDTKGYIIIFPSIHKAKQFLKIYPNERRDEI